MSYLSFPTQSHYGLLLSCARVYNLRGDFSCVATQNVVTLQNVVITTFCLALAFASIGKM